MQQNLEERNISIDYNWRYLKLFVLIRQSSHLLKRHIIFFGGDEAGKLMMKSILQASWFIVEVLWLSAWKLKFGLSLASIDKFSTRNKVWRFSYLSLRHFRFYNCNRRAYHVNCEILLLSVDDWTSGLILSSFLPYHQIKAITFVLFSFSLRPTETATGFLIKKYRFVNKNKFYLSRCVDERNEPERSVESHSEGSLRNYVSWMKQPSKLEKMWHNFDLRL